MEEELLNEMNEFISETDASSVSDDDGLPFEPADAFSTDPVDFIEMSERLMGKVENIFDLTRIYNRHSAKYLKACALLERGIKRLGSLCVTKYAMEENDSVQFPELKQLTTQKLYRMASFNFRKLDTALTEKLEKGNDLYPELTDMVFRYFNLLQRLRATERNIYNYHQNRYFGTPNWNPLIEGKAFSKKSWSKRYTSEKEEAPVFRAAPAFPILKEELKAEAVTAEAPAAAAPLLPAPEKQSAETGGKEQEAEKPADAGTAAAVKKTAPLPPAPAEPEKSKEDLLRYYRNWLESG